MIDLYLKLHSARLFGSMLNNAWFRVEEVQDKKKKKERKKEEKKIMILSTP